MTSSPHGADVKGDIFKYTTYPPSLVVIAFIFLELRRVNLPPPHPPPPVVENQKKSGLNRVNRGGRLKRVSLQKMA